MHVICSMHYTYIAIASQVYPFLHSSLQWRTEEGVRGLEPLQLAYGLRNKSVRMPQKMVFSTKNTKKLWGGAQPTPQTFPRWGGDTPAHALSPPGARGTSTPHSKILCTPLLHFGCHK